MHFYWVSFKCIWIDDVCCCLSYGSVAMNCCLNWFVFCCLILFFLLFLFFSSSFVCCCNRDSDFKIFLLWCDWLFKNGRKKNNKNFHFFRILLVMSFLFFICLLKKVEIMLEIICILNGIHFQFYFFVFFLWIAWELSLDYAR